MYLSLRYKKISQKKTKISKRYAKMMQFHKKFGGAAKGGGGAWTQPMHPLYTLSSTEDPLSKSSPSPPLRAFEDFKCGVIEDTI
jgi:hypothetical protein